MLVAMENLQDTCNEHVVQCASELAVVQRQVNTRVVTNAVESSACTTSNYSPTDSKSLSFANPLYDQAIHWKRERAHAQLQDVTCSLDRSVMVLDDAEETERLLQDSAMQARRLRGDSYAIMDVEYQKAAQSRQTAQEACASLERQFSDFARHFEQAELCLTAATDEPLAARLFQVLQDMRTQLESMSRAEQAACERLQKEAVRLEIDRMRLVNAHSLEHEKSRSLSQRMNLTSQTELALEKEQQQRLIDQLREERDKVLYLERLHQDLSEESLRVVGQRAELGAVRHQVERLTQDRRIYLEELQCGMRGNPLNSIPAEGCSGVSQAYECHGSNGMSPTNCNTFQSSRSAAATAQPQALYSSRWCS